MTDETAQLIIGDQQLELPIIEPTIGNDGVVIKTLRNDSGDVTFDPGFANTAGTRRCISRYPHRTSDYFRGRPSVFSSASHGA